MIWPISLLSIEAWILISAIIFLIRYFIYRKYQFLARLNIPHDPPSILKFGNMAGFLDPKKMFTRDNEQKKKHGAVWGSYMGLFPSITIHDPDMMRQIFIKEFSNFSDRQGLISRIVGKYMKHSVSVLKGKKWKRVRNTLSPTFSSAKLKNTFNITQMCTDQTLAVLQNKCKVAEGNFIAKLVFSNLSVDLILSTALGLDGHIQSLTEDLTELGKDAKNLFNVGLTNPIAILCAFLPPVEYICDKLNLSIFPVASVERFKKYLMAVIKKREETGKGRMDVLQLMLDAEVPEKEINEDSLRGITRDELVDNAIFMILASHENTANSMTYLAYNLAMHPDAQEACHREIDDAYQEEVGFDYETVKNLKYLEMCLNETLRLYNPVWRNGRTGKKDIVINGFMIPKDTAIIFPTFALSHDEEYWEDPWEFKPERMEDMSQIDPMVFQPFGCGPRNCIGTRLAKMEIKLALCKILHKFTIKPLDDTPEEPLELAFSIGVRPLVEFGLQVVPRENH